MVRTTLALLFIGGLITSANAQCGFTASGVPPYYLQVNMNGSTVGLDTASLSPILAGTAGCHLYYEIAPGVLGDSITLDCSGIGDTLPIVVRPDDNGIFDGQTGDSIIVNIILTDVGPPTITCPANDSVSTAEDMIFDCFATNMPIDASITDNCGGYTTSYTVTNPMVMPVTLTSPNDSIAGDEFFPIGVNTVTYTVTDISGNTATCSFVITVYDDEEPIWLPSEVSTDSVPGLIAQTYVDSSYTRSVFLDCNSETYASDFDYLMNRYLPSAIDNCDSMLLVTMDSSATIALSCAAVGPTINNYSLKTIYYLATDGANVTDTAFVLAIYTSDNEGPDYSDPAAVIPSDSIVTSFPGLYLGSDVTINLTDPNVCSIPLTTELLAIPVDCQTITDSTWTVTYIGGGPIPPYVPAGSGFNASQTLEEGTYNITYFTADTCGNASIYTFNLTIADTIVPLVTGCPALPIVSTSEAGNCYATVTWVRPTADDNCDSIMVVSNYTDPDSTSYPLISSGPNDYGIFPVGVSTVHYVFTDESGNTSTCEFQVVVEDDEAPTITCSGDQIINSICDSVRVPDYTGLANIFDNCPANGFTVTQVPPAGTLVSSIVALAAGNSFPVALSVTDAAGNPNPDTLGGTNECLFTVTLFDNDAPIPVLATLPTINPTNTPAASCGSYDLYAPIALDCNGDTIYGQASIAGATFNAGPPPFYTLSPNNYVINWTYDDGNGNVATQLQSVQVTVDTLDPILTCPSNIVVSADLDSCSTANVVYAGSVTDNCPGTVITYSPPSGSTFPVGMTTVTATATDASGNTSTCQFTVTVNDDQDPDFDCGPGGILNTLSTGPLGNDAVPGDCAYTVAASDSTLDASNFTDNCGIASVTHTLISKFPISAGYSSPLAGTLAGTTFTLTGALSTVVYTIRWTVTDVNGNTSTCNQILIVRDGEPPVITCPANQIRLTSTNGLPGDCSYTAVGTEFNATATDNCDNSVFLLNDYDFSQSLAGSEFPSGNTTVTWTAIDNAFNTSSCSFVITVNDDVAPVFTYCPPDVTLNNVSGDCENFVVWERPTLTGLSGGPDVTDNCTTAGDLVMTETIDDPSVQGAINNNYPFDAQSGANIFAASSFPVGTTTITYVVADTSGNTASCSFTVTILDTEAPTISNPGPQVLGSVCANATVPNYMALANVFDNCGNQVTVTQYPAPGTLLSAIPGLIPPVTNNIGNPPVDGQTFTVTITATDNNPNGGSSSASFVVTLDDTQNPVPNIPGAMLPPVSTTCGPITLAAPSANDCGVTLYGIPNQGMYVVGSNPPQYTFGLGSWNVLWTYIDAQNNTSSQSQLINVTPDVIPPSMICPADITVFTPSNSCTLSGITGMNMTQVFMAPVLNGTYYDLCGVASITYSLSGATTLAIKPGTNNNSISGETLNLGVTFVTYYVTDNAGNQSTCSARVTLRDNVAPILAGVPANVTVECNNVPAPPVIGVGGVTASDNCTASPNIIFGESSTKGINPALCSFYTYTITRTWTAFDASGNTSSQTQLITVHDNTAPVINAGLFPADMTVNTDNDLCTKALTINITNSLSDNCAAVGNLTVTNSFNGGGANASGVYPIGVTNVVFTVTDPCGNSSQRTLKVTVQDKQAPTPACVVSVAVPIGVSGMVTLNPASFNAASFDNCPGPLGLSLSPSTINCSQVGTNVTVVLTVTDQYGNSATCQTYVEVQDNVTPTITLCPADVTVGCATTLDPNLNPLLGTPSVSDNCLTIVSHVDVPVAPGPGLCAAINRIWTVKDAFNNSSSCIQKISILDNTPPAFNNAPANITVACGSTIPTAPTVTAADFCDANVAVTFTETSTKTSNNSCSDFTYTISRTWKATDDCGNTSTHTQTITVQDIVGPVFSGLPAPIVLYTGQFNSLVCSVPINLVLTSSNINDCEGFSNLTVTNNSPVGPHTNSASGTYPVGTYTVVFTATDKCGNSSTASVSITVIDDSKPVAKCHDIVNVALNNSGVAAITTADVNDKSTDNCGISSLSLNITNFDCSDLGPNAVVLTVTDYAGNTNVCNSIINIEDNIIPVITFCPADVTVSCSSSLDPFINPSLGVATALDNCLVGGVTYTDASTTPPAGYCSALLRTWLATDVDGNTATCIQKLTVQDNTAPTFVGNIPVDVTISCSATVPTAPTLTGSDFCDPVVAVTFNQTSTQTSNSTCSDFSYVITRTWTATDDCGNTATLTRKVTVIDNAAPAFVNVPLNITLFTESFNSQLCSAPVSLNLTSANVTDCEGFSNLTITNNSGIGNGTTNISGNYPVGTHVVTFSATDKCGNNSTYQVTIVVVDNSKPVAICDDIVNLSLNGAGVGTITPADVDEGSVDNCTIVNLSLSKTTFNCSNIGPNQVSLTVTDQAGNTNVCTSIVTVQDNQGPLITFCPADVSVNCNTSIDPNVNLSLGKATASDNCSGSVVITYSDGTTTTTPGFCATILRTWKATDGGGNTSTCNQKINVQDNTAPTFVGAAPADVTLACGSQVPAAQTMTATDFCDPSVVVTFNQTSNQTSNNTCTDYNYVVNRSWTATDDCGNTALRTQKITVIDNVAPVFSNMPGPITLNTSDFNSLVCSAPLSLILTSNNLSDCVGFNNLIITNNSAFGVGGANASGQYPVGVHQIKFTATDKCGNSAMATVTVTVVDNTKPVAICDDLLNVTINNNGIATILPSDVDEGSTDNCGFITLSLSQTQFDCTDLGDNIVTLTVTDAAGNTNVCTSIVHVNSTNNNSLTLTFTTTNESAPGNSDGSATVIVTGGSGSYTYLWNDPNHSTTATVNGLSAGLYTVTVTDLITGCVGIESVKVNVNSFTTANISGNIMAPNGQNVGLVQVDLTGSTLATQTTKNTGNYSFTVPVSSTVTVTPIKNIFPTNGVTALDMAIIQQHVTNPQTPTLVNPYMLIAGDINNDGSINGIDLAIGQAVILGNQSTFNNNTSWVFVPKSYVFPNPLNPFSPPYPHKLTYTNVQSNFINQDYWGIKVGDVNNSVSAAQAKGGNEVREYVNETKFVTYDKTLIKGSTITLDFTTENFKDILAYQFTMDADPEYLEVIDAKAGVLPGMTPDYFGLKNASAGNVTGIWYNNESYNLFPKENAFSMTFKVKKSGKKLSECLKLSDNQIITTAYNSNYKEVELGLKFINDFVTNQTPTFVLYQNQPNPFKHSTTISFELPRAEKASIEVMDLDGRVIKSIEKNYEKGLNREEIQMDNVTPGVFYYKLSTSSNSSVKKMVIIE